MRQNFKESPYSIKFEIPLVKMIMSNIWREVKVSDSYFDTCVCFYYICPMMMRGESRSIKTVDEINWSCIQSTRFNKMTVIQQPWTRNNLFFIAKFYTFFSLEVRTSVFWPGRHNPEFSSLCHFCIASSLALLRLFLSTPSCLTLHRITVRSRVRMDEVPFGVEVAPHVCITWI